MNPEAVRSALDTARVTLAGRYDTLEACIGVARLRDGLRDVPSEIMDVIIAVESELDGLPFGVDRINWEANTLKEKDAEADRYRVVISPTVLNALRSLVEVLEATEATGAE